MNIFVCIKEVLDPDAVNAMVLGGHLKIDPQTNRVVPEGIPYIMDAYDAQAIEVALRLRDRGLQCEIVALSVGAQNPQKLFQHAFALGVDRGHDIRDPAFAELDSAGVSRVLAQAIRHLGGGALVLCGRQASDDDQGVVGPGIAALLGIPCVTVARDVRADSDRLARVVRMLPDGEEVVEVELPAVVTVSNEVGTPRFPTVRQMMVARQKKAAVLTGVDLEMQDVHAGAPRLRLVGLVRAQAQGHCEFIQGETVQEMAANLARRLQADRLLQQTNPETCKEVR